VRFVAHGGGSVGGNCWLAVVPEASVVFAITSNMSGAGWDNTPQLLLQKFVAVAMR